MQNALTNTLFLRVVWVLAQNIRRFQHIASVFTSTRHYSQFTTDATKAVYRRLTYGHMDRQTFTFLTF